MEIQGHCTFEVRADKVGLKTKTNGDAITIDGLNLSQDNAASLAWIVNSGQNDQKLKIAITPI